MVLLNVSFGIFAFLPQGWLFMLFVIFIEGGLLSKFLTGSWKQKRFYRLSLGANSISGIIGIAISMLLNGGWMLVVWMPWVSKHEVYIRNLQDLTEFGIFYLCAFIATIIIEAVVNILMLKFQFIKNEYNGRKIITATLKANAISYVIGSLVLYSYSFS